MVRYALSVDKRGSMTATSATVRFEAKLLKPAAPENGGAWSFLVLPKSASSKLPGRGMQVVEGTLNGQAFRASLEPDGRKSHWLKVPKALREKAGAKVGDAVAVELRIGGEPLEAEVPPDLRKALAAAPKAKAMWNELTPAARTDWISWITSGKKAETRVKRVAAACDMLASGKKRVCCFDRSGFYSGSMCAPEAAE